MTSGIYKRTKEHCLKISLSHIGNKNPNFGKHISGEYHKCLECRNKFWVLKSKIKVGKGKFCSKKCYSKNHIRGYKRKDITDEKHPQWKGNNAKYLAIHTWVARKLGKPGTCEFCGKTELGGKHIHWANIDHTYKRDFNDWIRLCNSCHHKYDLNKQKIWKTSS